MPAAGGARRVLSARTLATAPTPTVPPTQTVYLALVVPKGLTADRGVTAASASAMVAKASAYWSSQTGGQVMFAVKQVLATYTSAFPCGTEGEHTDDMWTEAARKMPTALGAGQAPAAGGSAWCRHPRL